MKATVNISVTYDNKTFTSRKQVEVALAAAVQELAATGKLTDGPSEVVSWEKAITFQDTQQRFEQYVYCDRCFDGEDELNIEYTGVLPLPCAKCHIMLQVGHAHYVRKEV